MAYLDSILNAMNKTGEENPENKDTGAPEDVGGQTDDKDKNPPKKDFYGDEFKEFCKR